ncbi:hypothetical protein OE699_03110 [Sedimentimonas flavescens]|uniref:DUF6969 domain-containing protein n=1 Tax=Sedimentimonas flavescens TaxID=2851012 RepID=A0ABT2ZVQ2_9RHOB|nr:hypothetical protein [Sedimentimonas flavescens]MCV2877831.1 hypothetical protein [Sedimentimonas flavescens]
MADHRATPDKPLSRRLAPLDLTALPVERLEDMHDAAATVLECEHALQKSGMSVISEVLRGQGDFVIWERYPKGDIFDSETHSHYFYHSHTPEEMADGENGHFHLFVRPAGLAPGLKPWAFSGAVIPEDEAARFIHIGAISVDGYGRPLRLFTTNRWVTDETLYRAADIVPLLDRFAIELAHPNWAVSKWLTAMVRLHLPQLAALLHLRDAVIMDWSSRHAAETLEDRRLQNTSEVALDIPAQIAAVEAALGL